MKDNVAVYESPMVEVVEIESEQACFATSQDLEPKQWEW